MTGFSNPQVRRRRLTAWLPVLMCLLAIGGVAPTVGAAASLDVTTQVPDLTATPDLRIADGSIRLSLDEAIAIALQRNLSLVVQRLNEAEARFQLTDSRGIYDPALTGQLVALDETSPSASNLDGADVQTFEQQNWDLGISQLLSTGATIRVDFNNVRQETNSQFATINPSFRSDFDITWSQPLLEGFGRLPTERRILIARNNVTASRETLEQEVAATVQAVANAFWNLRENQTQLAVAVQNLDLARQLHEQNRVRVEVGTLAPLELIQSEAGVATREEDIILAEARIDESADSLRQLLNLERGPLWTMPIELDIERWSADEAIDVDAAIDVALAERPEVARKRLQNANLGVDARYFDNLRKPQLDLSVTYGLNGLGGDVTNRDFFTGEILSMTAGGYSDSLDQITQGDFDGWRVALDFRYPIRDRSAKAQAAIAELAVDRGETELANLELQVATEVRRAVRTVETAAKAIASAEVSQRLEERNLEAEQKRYDNGLSTSYQVLEIQEDLAAAASRLIAARAAYQRALVEYYRSVGQLEEEVGITLVLGGDG